MALRDELGIRMKNFYESVPKTKLLRRTPVAIRIDGKEVYHPPLDSMLSLEAVYHICSRAADFQYL